MRCDFCGSEGLCFDDCCCAKCLRPDDYAWWRYNCPEEYRAWLNKKRREGDDV